MKSRIELSCLPHSFVLLDFLSDQFCPIDLISGPGRVWRAVGRGRPDCIVHSEIPCYESSGRIVKYASVLTEEKIAIYSEAKAGTLEVGTALRD